MAAVIRSAISIAHLKYRVLQEDNACFITRPMKATRFYTCRINTKHFLIGETLWLAQVVTVSNLKTDKFCIQVK